jgi:hypothetical protein
MPYVDEVIEIMIKLYEGFVDLPTFLPQQFLLLLVVVLLLQLLVLRTVKKDLLRKLGDINIRYGFNQMFELIPVIFIFIHFPGVPPDSVGIRYDLARGEWDHLL